jgi:DNA-binding IclR family transcriptional regulator
VIVQCVAETGAGISLAALAKETRIPKPTIRRIAGDLVFRGVLLRRGNVYVLGPELERLGRRAELHRAFADCHGVLCELNARFGGFAWLIAGPEAAGIEPLDLVHDDELAPLVSRWHPLSLESLVTTAAGRLVLLDRPDLVERATRNGIPRWTPRSPATRLELAAALRQARDLGAAVETEQSTVGWRCVAVRVYGAGGEPAALGVTIPVQTGDFKRLLRATLSTTEAMRVPRTPQQDTAVPMFAPRAP